MEELCNSDGICNDNETEQNCPQDCIVIKFPDENNTNKTNNNTEENNTEGNDDKVYYIGGELDDERIFNNNLENSFYEQNNVTNINNVKKINVDKLSDSKVKITFPYLIFALFIFIFILGIVILLLLIRKNAMCKT
jgi:hypothetical protein